MRETAVLSNAPALTRITVEDFHRISGRGMYDKRAVLIRGVVFQKPSMSPLHFSVSKRLHELLLALRLPGVTVRHEGPLTLRDSEPLPDLAVVAGDDADFSHRHPVSAELVIEVAVSSVAADREMAAIYA